LPILGFGVILGNSYPENFEGIIICYRTSVIRIIAKTKKEFDMKIMEKSFIYRGFTVYIKKDVGFWRAYSTKNININGKKRTVTIDITADIENEAIDKAKIEIDRQLGN